MMLPPQSSAEVDWQELVIAAGIAALRSVPEVQVCGPAGGSV